MIQLPTHLLVEIWFAHQRCFFKLNNFFSFLFFSKNFEKKIFNESFEHKFRSFQRIGMRKNQGNATHWHLLGINVIQRNAIIVSGLSNGANDFILKKVFGKYGKICKCVLNPPCYFYQKKDDGNDNVFGTSNVAYIAYISEKGATNAVRNSGSIKVDKYNVQVSFAISK